MWDEENRIRTLSDNGRTQSYIYDADGERVIKRGRQGETAYINSYFVVRNGAVASKHVFNGTQRIATKLVMQESTTIPSGNGNGGSDNNGVGNGNVPPGWIRHGKTSNPGANFPGAQEKAQQLQSATVYSPSPSASVYEHQQYFYHPDHVGSTGFVTDANGQVYEHMEYFAFGETWVQERSNIERTPYLFTGKELDEETQLYYFGARYYDPRTSQWQSTDPILDKYLGSDPGELANAGVFNSSNLGLYSYSFNNPVNLYDPDGRVVVEVGFSATFVLKGGISLGISTQFDTENYELGVKLNSSARVGVEFGVGLVGTISPSSGKPAATTDDSEFFADASGSIGPFSVQQDIGSVKLDGPNKGQASGMGDVSGGGTLKDAIKLKPQLKFGASAGAGVRGQAKTDKIAKAVEGVKSARRPPTLSST